MRSNRPGVTVSALGSLLLLARSGTTRGWARREWDSGSDLVAAGCESSHGSNRGPALPLTARSCAHGSGACPEIVPPHLAAACGCTVPRRYPAVFSQPGPRVQQDDTTAVALNLGTVPHPGDGWG